MERGVISRSECCCWWGGERAGKPFLEVEGAEEEEEEQPSERAASAQALARASAAALDSRSEELEEPLGPGLGGGGEDGSVVGAGAGAAAEVPAPNFELDRSLYRIISIQKGRNPTGGEYLKGNRPRIQLGNELFDFSDERLTANKKYFLRVTLPSKTKDSKLAGLRISEVILFYLYAKSYLWFAH